MEEATEDLDIVEKIFEFFLDAYNSIFSVPLYIRTSTTKGTLFDVELHQKTPHSKQAGPIEEVLLEGYTTRHGKVMAKPVVKI